MGTSHYAHLAYGYDLGTDEAPEIHEAEEFGGPTVAWILRDEDGYVDEEMGAAIRRRLYEAIPESTRAKFHGEDSAIQEHYGLEILEHGWSNDGSSSYALVADSFMVEGGESVVLDPKKLADLVTSDGFDARLDRALEVLAGLTPTKPRGWTLMADR